MRSMRVCNEAGPVWTCCSGIQASIAAWKADRSAPNLSTVGWRQKAAQLCSCLSVASNSDW
jgi:hypothetical protein